MTLLGSIDIYQSHYALKKRFLREHTPTWLPDGLKSQDSLAVILPCVCSAKKLAWCQYFLLWIVSVSKLLSIFMLH